MSTFRWDHRLQRRNIFMAFKTDSPLVVTLGQQYNIGEKPTVILYTYINRHAGTPGKQQNQLQYIIKHGRNNIIHRLWIHYSYYKTYIIKGLGLQVI